MTNTPPRGGPSLLGGRRNPAGTGGKELAAVPDKRLPPAWASRTSGTANRGPVPPLVLLTPSSAPTKSMSDCPTYPGCCFSRPPLPSTSLTGAQTPEAPPPRARVLAPRARLACGVEEGVQDAESKPRSVLLSPPRRRWQGGLIGHGYLQVPAWTAAPGFAPAPGDDLDGGGSRCCEGGAGGWSFLPSAHWSVAASSRDQLQSHRASNLAPLLI